MQTQIQIQKKPNLPAVYQGVQPSRPNNGAENKLAKPAKPAPAIKPPEVKKYEPEKFLAEFIGKSAEYRKTLPVHMIDDMADFTPILDFSVIRSVIESAFRDKRAPLSVEIARDTDGVMRAAINDLNFCVLVDLPQALPEIAISLDKIHEELAIIPKAFAKLPVVLGWDSAGFALACGGMKIRVYGEFHKNDTAMHSFWYFRQGENKPLIPIHWGEFRESIKKVLVSVANDEMRYYLNGVFVDTEEKFLRVVTTDGHRLTAIRTSFSVDGHTSLIIPRDTAKKLLALPLAGKISWMTTERLVIFTASHENGTSLKIASKVIEGNFPKWREVVPDKQPIQFRYLASAFLEALSQILPMGSKKQSVAMVLQPSDGSLTLTCRDKESGWKGRAQLPVEIIKLPKDFSAEKMAGITFRADYLMDGISAIGDGQVSMRVPDKTSRTSMRFDSGARVHVVAAQRPEGEYPCVVVHRGGGPTVKIT